MKRFAFVAAAAALLGTACTSSPPPPPSGSLDLGWNFQRYRWTDQTLLTYTCALAGIDNVVLSSSTGQSLTVPCSDDVGDGATIPGVWVGAQNVTITGRRGSVPLYRSGAFAVTIAQNQVTQVSTAIQAYGLTGDMDVYANFVDQYGDATVGVICSDVNVTDITYDLFDYADNKIASGSVPCSDAFAPGVSFTGTDALDLDNYAIRLKAYNQSGAQTFDSSTAALDPPCLRPAFDHFGHGDVWNAPVYDIRYNGPTFDNYGFCQ